MAYLITCSGSKQNPVFINESKLENLSFNDELFESRTKMIKLSKIELDWDKTLPAWQLYSGTYSKLYPQVLEENWLKPNADIMILSALFGWIKHTDLIPFYNLAMADKISSFYVWKIWNHFDILSNLIKNTDIDLLSPDYRKAVIGRDKPIGIIPNEHFTDRGVQKGRWLNEQLNNL